jgi:hypothetical protein
MRTFALAVLCLLVQEPDLEKEVARLTERLSDDKIEVRDAARRELIALGPAAMPFIRRRAESAELELREVLNGVVRDFERADRLKFFLREPRKIRLKAEKMAIGEILKDLAKQSETPVTLEGVPAEEPVTVEIENVPFFQALQEICLAHGGLVFLLPEDSYSLESDDPVKIVRGDPKVSRKFIQGAFVVDLESVFIGGVVLGQKRPDNAGLNIVPGWERGIRPVRMKIDVTSVVDETGAAYAVPPPFGRDGMDIYINRIESVQLTPTPPATVTTFKEVAGKIEFEFPSDGYVARLENPIGKKFVEAPGGPATFMLHQMVRQGDHVLVTVDAGGSITGPADFLNRVRFFALDSRDRIYPHYGGRGRGTGGDKMRWTFSFTVPEEADVKELRAVRVAIDKDHPFTVRFPWKLENVRFR